MTELRAHLQVRRSKLVAHGNNLEWSLAPHVAEAVKAQLAYRRRFWPSEPFPFASHRSLAEVFAASPDDAA